MYIIIQQFICFPLPILMISKVTISNYKSFSHITIPILDIKSAIVGPNSAGKSNLLDAISYCFCLDDPR